MKRVIGSDREQPTSIEVICSNKSLLLLLLSRFSRVRLCVTPQTAAHPALPSLGFSRQKYWSGLLFPSPIHESEIEVMSYSQRSCGLQPTRLLHRWDLPGKSTGAGCHCLLLSHYITLVISKDLHILSYLSIYFHTTSCPLLYVLVIPNILVLEVITKLFCWPKFSLKSCMNIWPTLYYATQCLVMLYPLPFLCYILLPFTCICLPG